MQGLGFWVKGFRVEGFKGFNGLRGLWVYGFRGLELRVLCIDL